MQVKSLLDLTRASESKDIDKIFMEYAMMLVGAKNKMEKLRDYIENYKGEKLDKQDLLGILEDEEDLMEI